MPPFLRRGWPAVVPILWLLLAIQAQDRGRLGAVCLPHAEANLVYDEFDFGAYTLRGLNAYAGRAAGAPREGLPLWDPPEYAKGLEEDRPLANRYYLEYPHLALLLFRLGFEVQPAAAEFRDPTAIPAGLADGHHLDVSTCTPQTDSQARLWTVMAQATWVYMTLMAFALLGLMRLLSVGYEPGGRGAGLCAHPALLALPAMVYFSINRFDVLPALLVALGLFGLGRGRIGASAFWMALATLLKVYPILMAPLVVRYLLPRPKQAAIWAGTYAAVILGVGLLIVSQNGLDAALAPYRFQLTRPPEKGWTLYWHLLPGWMADNSAAASACRLGTVALVLLLLMPRAGDLTALVRRSAIVLIYFVSLAVFYSPQWVVWLAPLLVPLAGRQRSVFWLLVGLDLVTYLTFPVTWFSVGPLLDELGAWRPSDDDLWRYWPAALVYARAALLTGLAIVLWQAEWRAATAEENPKGP